MSMHFGGYMDRADRQRKGRRGTARDAKKKHLSERRKPLNIDHLNKEKLIEKAQEVYDW
jgi:troponin T